MPRAPRTLTQLRAAYRWDSEVQRWRNARGVFVKARALKAALARYVLRTGKEIRTLAGQMARGEVTIGAWQLQTAALLKSMHLAQTAAARGGFHNLTARDYGKLGSVLRFQYGRLGAFALDVEAGRLSEARILARAEMYSRSGNGTYENARRLGAVGAYTEERRLLAASEHCPTCVDSAAAGWVPLGTLPEIGDSECGSNCLCQFSFRDSSP